MDGQLLDTAALGAGDDTPKPRINNGFLEFPVYHVRGGTSTGIVLWDRVTPAETELKEELVRHIMGVPLEGTHANNRQITGLGRTIPTSNKVFFADLEYDDAGSPRIVSNFAQLANEKAAIDWSVNCGNMSAALPMWAYDIGFLSPDTSKKTYSIDIRNTNTGVIAGSRIVFDRNRRMDFCEIPGVSGRYPEVDLFLYSPAGAKTGKLLPTGAAREQIDGIDVSCVDVAVPMVILKASDLGKTAQETIPELDADTAFKERLRRIWVEAGQRMELKNRDGRLLTPEELAASETIPKICIIGAPENCGNVTVRYFTPQSGHNSMAVTGGCCLAAACLVEGSVAQEVATGVNLPTTELAEYQVDIENPAGVLTAIVEAASGNDGVRITKAAYTRSAQILLKGYSTLYRASDALIKSLGL